MGGAPNLEHELLLGRALSDALKEHCAQAVQEDVQTIRGGSFGLC
jgi:hypothetical protein